MSWFGFENIQLNLSKRFFFSNVGGTSVRLPISLNIVGKVYYLQTDMISKEFIYLKVYKDDFDFLPLPKSHLVLFLNLNLFNNGKFDLEGKLERVERLNGNTLGLWISYQTETEKEKMIISEFVRNHYTPRYSVRFSVDIQTNTKTIQAEAINLSEKGIFIEAPLNQLEERELCNLILRPENFSIAVIAEVSWINKGKMYDKPNGYGLRFLHDKKAESKIAKYLEVLKQRSEIIR